jgi:ABC-2 type transport system permease protein
MARSPIIDPDCWSVQQMQHSTSMSFYPQLLCELRREYLLWRSYRLNALSSLVMWGAVFPILMVTLMSVAANAGVTYGAGLQTASLIGFLIWKLCAGVLTTIPQMIEQEAGAGTLENVMVTSSHPFPLFFFFRVLARSLRSSLETFLLAVVLTFVFRLPLALSPAALLVTFLTLAGVWGVGFGLAGLALIYKNVGGVTSMVAYLAFIISGAFVPIDSLGVTFIVMKFVFPMTWGIELLRHVLINGHDLSLLVRNGSLAGLLFQSAVMLTTGTMILNGSLKRARQRGDLGTY